MRGLIQAFYTFDIQQISRVENAQADALIKLKTCTPFDLCDRRAQHQGTNIAIVA